MVALKPAGSTLGRVCTQLAAQRCIGCSRSDAQYALPSPRILVFNRPQAVCSSAPGQCLPTEAALTGPPPQRSPGARALLEPVSSLTVGKGTGRDRCSSATSAVKLRPYLKSGCSTVATAHGKVRRVCSAAAAPHDHVAAVQLPGASTVRMRALPHSSTPSCFKQQLPCKHCVPVGSSKEPSVSFWR